MQKNLQLPRHLRHRLICMRFQQVNHRHRLLQQTIYQVLAQMFRLKVVPKVQQYHFHQLELLKTPGKLNLLVDNVPLHRHRRHRQQSFRPHHQKM